MRGSAKVFVITGLTFVALLLMYYLPVMNVGGAQLRQVDVLADLDADSTERYDAESITIDEVKSPKARGKTRCLKVWSPSSTTAPTAQVAWTVSMRLWRKGKTR